MFLALVASSFLLATVSGQEVLAGCPAPNGFFADSVQCDKYYHCEDDVLTEKLCPDGMGFNDLNSNIEKCEFLFQVNCDGRPDLQIAKPADNCPRQNGYFPHGDESNCRQFFFCSSGVSSMITCPESLRYSITSGACVWPEDSGRTNCASENKYNFTCPTQGIDPIDVHPRYADPDDCQFFYVCINGKTPRRNGCSFGKVYNSETQFCDNPKDVPDCANYYTEYFENYFSTLGDNSGNRVSADIVTAAKASGYPVPEFRERVRIQPGFIAPSQRGTTTTTTTSTTTPATRRRPVGGRPLRTRPGGDGPRPGGVGVQKRRRKRPITTTSTTTTTTTPPPEYEYYYEYYDYPEETTVVPV